MHKIPDIFDESSIGMKAICVTFLLCNTIHRISMICSEKLYYSVRSAHRKKNTNTLIKQNEDPFLQLHKKDWVWCKLCFNDMFLPFPIYPDYSDEIIEYMIVGNLTDMTKFIDQKLSLEETRIHLKILSLSLQMKLRW